MLTPIPHRDRENASRGSGPVVTYQLSPEELEKYRAQPKDKALWIKKPVGVPNPELKGDGEMLTKEQYFEERIAGNNRTAIMKKHFGKNPAKFYAQLKEWGIKDPICEEAAIAEYQLAKKSAEPQSSDVAEAASEPVVPAENAEDLKAEIEKLRVANEIIKVEINLLREDNETYQKELREQDAEIERLTKELEQVRAAAQSAVNEINNPGAIVIRIPIISGNGDRFVMMEKVQEEYAEIGKEIMPMIDRTRAVSELLDLLQAFVGLIHEEMADLIVEDVETHLQRYFRLHNDLHNQKISNYAKERGWKVASGE